MLGFDDDDHPEGVKGLLDTVLDLHRQTLLHLQATSEDLDDTWELGEPRDIAVGDVANVHLAKEGKHVVLTEGIEVDVLDDDHLPIVLLEHRRAEDLVGGLGHALGEEAHGFAYTLWGLDEAFALGVFTQQREDLGVMVLELFVCCH